MGSSSKKSKKETKHKKHKRSSPSYERDESYSPDEKRRRRDEEDEERSRYKKYKKEKKQKKEKERDSVSPRKDEKRDRRGERDNTNGRRVMTEEPPAENDQSANGESSASLSIEETNKLREKLGLKPLDVGNSSSKGETEKKEDFVHAPAEDLWEKKKQEELREKLRAIKEKRTINKRIGKVKGIGNKDEDDLDASSWVQQSRSLEKKKKIAEKREKEMAEMDAEFGVGGLVKKELNDMRAESYTAKDLKGLTVKHSLEMFREGRSEILTLEDKGVLDENDEDVLVGANLKDLENAKRNIDIKSKGSGYQAYEEEEVDELGFFKPKSMLSKYDEEIDGIKRDEFKIGVRGKIDTTWEQQKEKMKKEIRAHGVSLAPPQLKIASEYLTEEEMKFKKRKKKVRKVRKRETLKAEDLMPLPGSTSASDFGSRKSKSKAGNIPGWDEGVESAKVGDSSITSTTLQNPAKSVIIDDDDAGNELQKALDKARKAKFVKANMVSEDTGAEKVARHLEVLSKIKVENPIANYSTTISLNSTDEFCRQVGIGSDLSNIKDEPAHHETSAMDNMDMDIDENEEEEGGWSYHVKDDAPGPSTEQPEVEDDGHAPIEAEPLAGGGLAGALKLFGRKGYLVEEKKKNSVTISNKQKELLSANYSIEDKNAVDHLDKYANEKYLKDRSRGHDRGIVMEFEEKKNYKPDVKIDYVDEGGRSLNAKEAFRKLSHRFHGKGSGKMKQEKRQKKLQESEMMLRMSSTDTPLNTVAMMKEKLQTEASPYIVLSGAGKTFQAGGAGRMSKQ